jgi:hypothetical protein
METIVYCVLSLLAGIVYGWRLREIHAKVVTKRIMQELSEELEEAESDELIQINIEQHSGVFYVYNKQTDEFMGQGSSKEQLEDVLAKRFPGKRFACNEKVLKEVGFIS